MAELRRGIFKVLKLPLKLLPLWMDAIGAGLLVSSIVDKNHRLRERLKGLGEKVFFFYATDIRKGFYLHIEDGGIKIVPHFSGETDVTMKGTMDVLLGLLTGEEDPDTIFFSRRLEISGDTGVAIHFKNILGSL